MYQINEKRCYSYDIAFLITNLQFPTNVKTCKYLNYFPPFDAVEAKKISTEKENLTALTQKIVIIKINK